MKKYIFLLVSLIMSFSCFFSCSSDDDVEEKFIIPEVPGANLNEGEIQFVYVAPADTSRFTIDIQLEDTLKSEIKINWGDSQKLTKYKSGKISYTFPASDKEKEYIITVQTSDIAGLTINDVVSANRLKSIFLGNCPKLNAFSFHMIGNRLENFDVTKCTQFKSINGTFYINTINFDFIGLSKIETLNLQINESYPVEIKDMNIKFLEIWLNKPSFAKFHLKNCANLENLSIMGYAYNWNQRIRVQDFNIETPHLKKLYINELETVSDFDLGKAPSNELVLFGFDCFGDVIFNPDTKKLIEINNMWEPFRPSTLDSLDFSMCKSAEYVSVRKLNTLKKINIEGMNNLKWFFMDGSDHLEDIEIGTLEPIAKSKNQQPEKNDGYIRLSANR